MNTTCVKSAARAAASVEDPGTKPASVPRESAHLPGLWNEVLGLVPTRRKLLLHFRKLSESQRMLT